MLFKLIESEGLAHYSYLIGDRKEAVIIDPRRDCDIYVEETQRYGFRITHILETHRNEDYVIGSVELAERTGAEIWHADSQLEYRYGQSVEDGQEWNIGSLKLEAIHSPGHTPGSMSYLLHEISGSPWMVFTGDSFFAGNVGRVDLLGMDKAEKMASLLYETIYDKLLPLGDHVIICPAHGSGSVCGSSIADRMWTTIGLERRLNPLLQLPDRSEFIEKVAKEMERPPYFRLTERLNIEGAPLLGPLPVPAPLTPHEFNEKAKEAIILDIRSTLGFASAHIPNAVSIWQEGLPSFVGWFLPPDQLILLVNDDDNPVQATRYLIRLGYDNLAGYLSGGMLAWNMAGLKSDSTATVTVQELCNILDEKKRVQILDVRSSHEIESTWRIPNSQNIHVTELPKHVNEVPKDLTVYIFCGSGLRSMTAASLLQQQGWRDLTVVLGGLAGWSSITCPIK